MLVKDILTSKKTCISYEFFPPKVEENGDRLFQTIADLIPLDPAYVSVTYGAGGSTRDRTHELLVRIRQETDLTVVSHLTCVGSSRNDIHAILSKYSGHGIENILALRGDLPKGQTEWEQPQDGFAYASDLVTYIKKHFPQMGIGVAGFPEGHPETPNRLKEIDYLRQKVDAGADYIVTQLFFDNRDFYDFCERCELADITVPIIAGIMPITTRNSMVRMAELAAGARIPARLLKAVERAGTDEYVERMGVHWAAEQFRDLIDNNVRGIHLYTLNSSTATLRIYKSLGIQSSNQLVM
jgi:methylenetetrahydrofolate reductase (NADPH)